MNPERRQIIVSEIMHWRRSKLLPDQYCDFLLNLYATDQEREQLSDPPPNGAISRAVHTLQKATGKQWFLTLGIFTLIAVVVFYFNHFPLALQISTVTFGTLLLLLFGHRIRKRSESTGLSSIALGMLLLLGGGLYILNFQQYDDMYWKVSLLALCAVVWIWCGIKMKIALLHLCGWLSLLLVYGWLLFTYTDTPKWFEVQLYWLPVAGLFGWFSWFMHRWSKLIAAVLFVISILSFYLPEVYTLFTVGSSLLLQLQLIIKVALGGLLLFAFRKYWMVWIV
ncbi:hypothetical protein [Paenibacillus yanchengensis]|uniref:DUF2157 domain-containing protein n=1 Tax=Paenibacillus yanchengensis TaxID=2035833 RepID=A0ABW4YK92_9BACL